MNTSRQLVAFFVGRMCGYYKWGCSRISLMISEYKLRKPLFLPFFYPQHMRFAFRDFDGVDILGVFYIYIYHFFIQIGEDPERRNHV